jgi:hypothetical protein
MIGAETTPTIPYAQAERPPTAKELALWAKAEKTAKRVNLRAYMMKLQYHSIRQTHKFALAHQTTLNEPSLPDLEQRMIAALSEIEKLKDAMCGVNRLELGVNLSEGGNDLDIIEPEPANLGWIIPAVLGAVVVIGIIYRWATLETEVSEVTAQYNGVLRRSDMALCADPNSQMCQDWQSDKSAGGYFKRETLIDSVKNAISSVGSGAKTGLGWGLALAIPVLLWLYMPKSRSER